MTDTPKNPRDPEDLTDYEVQLVVAWPSPKDPPPRSIRLPGLRIEAYPQSDGSVLYEVKYRSKPYVLTKRRKQHRDTVQMKVPWVDKKK